VLSAWDRGTAFKIETPAGFVAGLEPPARHS
jgi:hypothetical protein